MSTRTLYLFGLLAVCLLLGISVYLQLFAGFVPCPLCTLQRLAFVVLGILFLFGVVVHESYLGRLFIDFFALITSGLGLFFAGWQTWLQHSPITSNTECGVSLQYMLQALPVSEVIQKIFAGSAECTQRGWDFMYLNMPEWAVVWFAWFLTMSVYLLTRRR